MKEFVAYIVDSFGVPASAQLVQADRQLPLYLSHRYQLFQGDIAGKPVIWARVRQEVPATDGLYDQKRQMEDFFKLPVVFVFDNLDSWQRKRLIEKRIGFLQTGKQLFVPELLLQLDNIRAPRRVGLSINEHLSFSCQLALLYHLQREPLDNIPPLEIAGKLGYSAMTVTRIIRELEQPGWIRINIGKERSFKFTPSRKELWQLALPRLRNPVKEIWYSEGPFHSTAINAGESALASYTSLGFKEGEECALGREQFRSLKTLQELPELSEHREIDALQVWQYDPRILAVPGTHLVDKLSLYLSLQHETNERVQAALEELVNQITW